jgi:O-antigen/teichoic acid export membrane protein
MKPSIEQQMTSTQKEGSLTRRAALTSVSSLLQQAAQFIVTFVVTPIIISGLGAELYGAWLIIQQSVGYLTRADLRPMGTLKFTLGISQHDHDLNKKKRQIGAAIFLWLLTFPIVLVGGVALVWATPYFIQTASEYVDTVQIAMGVTIISLAINRVLSLPSSALRGMNLDYKAMGLNALMILAGGGFTTFVIWRGWGLPGVAIAGLVSGVGIGVIRFFVVRRALPWFGVAVPTRQEMISFAKLSGWLFLSSMGGAFLNASDILLLGIVLSPSVVAIYAVTGAVLRMARTFVRGLLGSISPGVAGLCGKKDWMRIEKVRTEANNIGIGVMTVIGVGVLAFNKAFLNLWVGEGFYVGDIANIFLVLIAFGMVLSHIDTVILSGMLQFQSLTLARVSVGVTIVIGGGISASLWGVIGMVVVASLGYLGLSLILAKMISLQTQRSVISYYRSLGRSLTVAGVSLSIAYLASFMLFPRTWFSLAIMIVFSSGLTMVCMWTLGLRTEEQRFLITRLASLYSTR